jgi:LPXTG-site transpeptidase (sortase) family protein
MTKKDKIRFLIVRSIGNFLVIFAVFGVFATFGPALYYEATYKIAQARGVRFTISQQIPQQANLPKPQTVQVSEMTFADVLSGPKEKILNPVDTEFGLIIPKIGANTKIIQNVDPSDPEVFLPALKKGVAHAAGTLFPGQKGNIYLFAHSTDNFWDVGRYNAIFYLLKDLKIGDDVVIFFRNIRHNYIVKEIQVVDSTEISYLKNPKTGKERLILQTCWPPGTTWQRLLVFAEPK